MEFFRSTTANRVVSIPNNHSWVIRCSHLILYPRNGWSDGLEIDTVRFAVVDLVGYPQCGNEPTKLSRKTLKKGRLQPFFAQRNLQLHWIFMIRSKIEPDNQNANTYRHFYDGFSSSTFSVLKFLHWTLFFDKGFAKKVELGPSFQSVLIFIAKEFSYCNASCIAPHT